MPRIMKSKQEMEEESNINDQTGLEDDNSSQVPDLPPVEDTAITFDDMEDTSSVATPPSNTQDEVNILQGLSDQVNANIATLQGRLDASRGEVEDANEAIGEFPDIRDEIEEDLNIRGLQEGVGDINSLIQSRKRGLERRIQALESQPVAIGMIGRQQQQRRTEAVRELADLSVVQMARQGQLEAAEGVLERKLEAEMVPLSQDLENSKYFYEQNRNLLSNEQQKQFQIKIAQDQRAYEKTKKDRERINGLLLTAAENGASLEDIKKIDNSESFGDAYAAASDYITTEEENFEFKTVGDVGYAFDPKTGTVQRVTGRGDSEDGVYESNPAIRNKNPLNIKDPTTGEFMTFSTAEEGFKAAQRDLLMKMTGRSSREIPTSRQVIEGIAVEGTGRKIDGNATLRELIDTWAPPSDNNLNNENYVNKVASDLGVSPQTRIGTLTGRVDELSRSMAEFEGWQPTELSPLAQAFVDGTFTRDDLKNMSSDVRDTIYNEIAASGRSIDETGEFEKLSTTKKTLQERLEVIDSVLANEMGLELSSGAATTPFSPESATWRSALPFGAVVDVARGSDAKNDFLADVKYIANNLVFDKLIELKKGGATFGALSEGELQTIGSAAETLASMLNEDQTALDASEDKVRNALNDLQTKWRDALAGTEAEMQSMTESMYVDNTEVQQADALLRQ